ncbi:insulinase family protein [Nonomuraea sp. MG754425]|uniref:M16 family metallopeptidase n=1 Tax=Nonomuraea sp. MG754425 TaxID=2570319 RepID=UPI001F210B1A|nr:pitrilysin family protein [Nonomuraea sp. MG754425]MCF6473562.1 insulinase family protein [Nonomuraea sp. MG754425]
MSDLPIQLPGLATVTLANGMVVRAVQRRHFPLIELRMALPAWYADLAAGTLVAATQFDDVERSGFHASAECASDAFTVRAQGLAVDLEPGLTAIAQALSTPSLDADLIRRARFRLAHQAESTGSAPTLLAWRELLATMYGDHPLAVLSPGAEELRKVTLQDVERFRQERMQAAGAVLTLSGGVPLELMIDAAAGAFSELPCHPHGRTPPPAEPAEQGIIRRLAVPGATQTSVTIGFPAVIRRDPRFPAAEIANLVIGGYFSSRLTRRLRQERGYAYWVRSSLTCDPGGPALAIATNVRDDVGRSALQVIRDDLSDLAAAGPPAEEVDHARRHLLGSTRLELATQSGATDLVFALARSGLTPKWLRDHCAHLDKVTPDDIRDFAAAFLRPAQATTVVASREQNV